MTTAALDAGGFLTLVMLVGGVLKVRVAEPVVAQLAAVGVPRRAVPALGAVELAAVAGLLLGLLWRPLAAAAALGCVLYFVGAVLAHVRVGDRDVAPAAVLLVLSGATLALVLAAG